MIYTNSVYYILDSGKVTGSITVIMFKVHTILYIHEREVVQTLHTHTYITYIHTCITSVD